MTFLRRAITSRVPAGGVKSDVVGDWPWSGEPPDWFREIGQAGTIDTATGVPPLLGALLLLSNSVAMTTPMVYEKRGAANVRLDDADYDLLHSDPTGEGTGAFPFYGDGTMAIAASGNAYIRKWKAGGRVKAMTVLDSRQWRPRRSGGEVVFDKIGDTQRPPATRSEIIHLRWPSTNGGLEGVAPITQLRLMVQQALARDSSVSRMWESDAHVGLIVKTPQQMTKAQADEWYEEFKEQHSGPENAGRPWITNDRNTVERLPLSLADVQFVESHRVTRESTCEVYQIPPRMLGDSQAPVDPDDAKRFSTFGLGPLYKAWDDALTNDRDLLPGGRFFEFLADSLRRPDTAARYAAYKDARQGSWITGNEIRALENYGPMEGGDEIQQTVVGGAPNPDNKKPEPAAAGGNP